MLAKKHVEDEKKRLEEEKTKEAERRNLGKLMTEAKVPTLFRLSEKVCLKLMQYL